MMTLVSVHLPRVDQHYRRPGPGPPKNVRVPRKLPFPFPFPLPLPLPRKRYDSMVLHATFWMLSPINQEKDDDGPLRIVPLPPSSPDSLYRGAKHLAMDSLQALAPMARPNAAVHSPNSLSQLSPETTPEHGASRVGDGIEFTCAQAGLGLRLRRGEGEGEGKSEGEETSVPEVLVNGVHVKARQTTWLKPGSLLTIEGKEYLLEAAEDEGR